MKVEPGYEKRISQKVSLAFSQEVSRTLSQQQRNLANLLIYKAVERAGEENLTVAELEGVRDLVLNDLSVNAPGGF